MAHFVLIENPFDERTHKRFLHQKETTIRAWLESKFKGFKEFSMPTICCVNDEYVLRKEWSTRKLKEDDIITFAPAVGDPVSIIVAVVVAVAVAVTITILTPTPQTPGDIPEPESVYKLTGQYNQTRVGEVIPVPYGRVRRFPDYAASTYNQYVDNEQLFFALLNIGPGDYEILDGQIEDTQIASYDDAQFDIVDPFQNPAGIFENNVVTASEVSSIELFGPNEPEFDDWVGPFILNPADTFTNKVEVDIVLPSGLYFANKKGGLDQRTVQYLIEFQMVDDLGDPVSDWLNPDSFMKVTRYMRRVTPGRFGKQTSVSDWVPYSSFETSTTRRNYSRSRRGRYSGNSSSTTRPAWQTITFEFPAYGSTSPIFGNQYGIRDSVWTTSDGAGQQGDTIRTEGGPTVDGFTTQLEVKEYTAGYSSITNRTSTPIRFTRREILPDEGRWQVRMKRRNNADRSHRVADTLQWESARAFLPSNTDFGDLTLMAFQARASNSLNDNSQQRINVWVNRKLQTWDAVNGWSDTVSTRSIVWAFCDVFRAKYGGKFGDTILDLPALKAMDDFYTARGDYFDYIFDRRTTVHEAAKTIARAGRGLPMIVGTKMTIVRDSPATIPTTLFGPHNIEPGSFSWELKFTEDSDYDAVEVVYTDGDTFQEKTVLCRLDDDPEEPINPERIPIPGIVSRNKAYEEGMHIRANRRYLTQQVTFRTGLEGRLPAFGSLCGVAHDIPQWGQTGYVKNISGTTITLRDKVVFADGETHQIGFRDRYGSFVGPFIVTAGSSEREVTLSSEIDTSNFVFDGSITLPLFFFGISNDFYKQMKISRLSNAGENVVEVTCVNYSPIPHSFDGATAPDEGEIDDAVQIPNIPTFEPITVEALPNAVDTVNVKWNAAFGAQKYVIQASDDGTTWIPVAETTATFYALQVTVGEIYVRVAAVNQGQSAWQQWNGYVGEIPEEVEFSVTNGAVSFPVNVDITSATVGAEIRWSTSSLPDSVEDGSQYTAAVSIAEGETLYARAFSIGGTVAGDGNEETYNLTEGLSFARDVNSQYITLI